LIARFPIAWRKGMALHACDTPRDGGNGAFVLAFAAVRP